MKRPTKPIDLVQLHLPLVTASKIVWLRHLQTRKPIPESSVPSIQGALNKWLWPTLGTMPLSEVNHAALRALLEKMSDAGLAPKTICSYVTFAKQVVNNLADEHGKPVIARQWDDNRIDLPVVNKRNQRRVTLTKVQIEALIAVCDEPWEWMLYLLCCASGLRISEALAVDREHLSDDGSVIYVRQQSEGQQGCCLPEDRCGLAGR